MEHIDWGRFAQPGSHMHTFDLAKKKKKKRKKKREERERVLRPNKSHNMESGVRAPDEI